MKNMAISAYYRTRLKVSMTDGPASLQRFAHPGTSRRPGKPTPKGRQIDPSAVAAIESLLGERPRRRDLLIQHLHLIQDRFGGLAIPHLAALAAVMRLSFAEVYEVATFYARFDVIQDNAARPALTVRVCDSLSCAMAGAERLLAELPAALGGEVRVLAGPCIGRCDIAPAVEVGTRMIGAATADAIAEACRQGHTEPAVPAYPKLDEYRAGGGYRLLQACRGDPARIETVIAEVERASLRGLGGAGFPTARKWRLVRAEPAPRLFAVNADEGEPGTFKDRHFLEIDPHRFLEGTLIAAAAIDAAEVYIYLRDEYPALHRVLATEIDAVTRAGLTPPGGIELRRGAGAYICGEESAMLESIEGKRGLPRHKPPYPAQIGLFGRPTLINNVETLYWLREIVERGADWWLAQGRHGGKGLRGYSVSGRVREPGVKIAPAGITARELIEEHCGGMAPGHQFVAYLPGGASGGILPARLADLPLDFGSLEKHGCLVGSAAVIVLSEQDDLRAAALNLLRFFEDESCGQCTPCRVGTEKAVKLMHQPVWDQPLLEELAAAMRDASICGLGQAAANPLTSLFRHFAEVTAS